MSGELMTQLMKYFRYEQGTPEYELKPKSCALLIKDSASIIENSQLQEDLRPYQYLTSDLLCTQF